MIHTTVAVEILVLAALSIFVLGFIIGWVGAHAIDRIQQRSLRIGIAIVVTAIWVTAILAEIFIPAYTVSVVMHGIMGALVGYLFSSNDSGFTINLGGE